MVQGSIIRKIACMSSEVKHGLKDPVPCPGVMSLPELACEIWAEAERDKMRQRLDLWEAGIPETPEDCEDCEAVRRRSLIADMAVADGHPKKRLAAMLTTMQNWGMFDQKVMQQQQLNRQSQPKTCTKKVAMEAKRAYAAAHCTALHCMGAARCQHAMWAHPGPPSPGGGGGACSSTTETTRMHGRNAKIDVISKTTTRV
jgi:hypothetical protein